MVAVGAVEPAGAVLLALWRRCFFTGGVVEPVAGLALAVEPAGLAVGFWVVAGETDLPVLASAAGLAGADCAGFIDSFFTVVTGAEVAFALLAPVAGEF